MMAEDSEHKELKIEKIRNGTVIDHISGGMALDVLRILGITGREGIAVSVAMNVPSKTMAKKDIVKVEGRELHRGEVDKIALIAPQASINIIREYSVVKKQPVILPNAISDTIRCPNPLCITNSHEPVEPLFRVVGKNPVRLRCDYCETILNYEEIRKQL